MTRNFFTSYQIHHVNKTLSSRTSASSHTLLHLKFASKHTTLCHNEAMSHSRQASIYFSIFIFNVTLRCSTWLYVQHLCFAIIVRCHIKSLRCKTKIKEAERKGKKSTKQFLAITFFDYYSSHAKIIFHLSVQMMAQNTKIMD